MIMDALQETEAGRLATALEEAIGQENVERLPDIQIDGLKPVLVVKPGTRSETAQCLQICSRSGARVTPAGLMTWLECGNPMRSVDVVLSLSRMCRVVDYSPADLTIWSNEATTTSDLHRATREDIPFCCQRTPA